MHQRGQHRQETEVTSSSKLPMAKPALLSRNHYVAVIAFLILCLTAVLAFISRSISSCTLSASLPGLTQRAASSLHDQVPEESSSQANGLELVRGKSIVLVSHELSLTGGPLLLMELAVLLKRAGGDVKWITNQKDTERNPTSQGLEAKLIKNGIQILLPRGSQTVEFVKLADLIVLNTAVAGKWIDATLSDNISEILKKTLWWIHEMRGHYFKLDLVKHLPQVGAAMIDSYATADYWKNRTEERLSITMPPTYVVHLGNSKELTEASEDVLARGLLRQHVRENLGLSDSDIVFAIINSVSRGKGQDLFLKSFVTALDLIEKTSPDKRQINLHAAIVGCDTTPNKYEMELRSFVAERKIEHLVHFVNKTMNVIPYLAAIDVLVQNSQARGECFGRITIEAMAFQLPVLGTAAGGTKEIIVNGTTGLLHPVGKEGMPILAQNMVQLVNNAAFRASMGRNGHGRVQERFLEKHMAHRIGQVLQKFLPNKNQYPRSFSAHKLL
ncbi:hypothetical protein KP509_20G041300 [Ceratopteris richardii]|uniref:Glycosyl transferase family 1 domain-containing protein n=1 Tax=Ceratopteris richardii TaxID=49495 RepID=A0A8T2SI12_CERRI|nr:hypothetical protein KP509_20G041300 [Ceratopteris richardii]